MTDPEKIEQARALYDAGIFRKKIIERAPHSIYADTAILECGHAVKIPRSAETEYDCYKCEGHYDPTAPRTRLWDRWTFLYMLPAVLMLMWLSFALSRKETEFQDLKRRVAHLEELVKSR